ncbi:hypothetical protein B9Z55_010842 [Caenorhabditis nigoni]|uniref:Sdz-33 F-box domain-containing protein n=1 Tax=Caenorhabditis nigoni TaxID=1611254 RepID=A0A2G5UHI7_9PELO|nr:hypothetical protein B9Z55_010842 [Caenorhabditis nigoni]
MGWTVITLTSKDESAITFKLTSHNDGIMTSLDDIPVNLDVLKGTFFVTAENRVFAVSNQGMSLGEWIQHLCSIFQCENYEVRFTIGTSRFDIQLLRNILPKLRSINLVCGRDGHNEQGILYAQRILRTFLPDIEILRLSSVPLHESLSLQHIAATNLKKLDVGNFRFDDLLSLNVERCRITSHQITLLDLNRFFRLWKKGSNPKLKLFIIFVRTEINSDWNILLKGLQAVEAEAGEANVKNFTIQHSAGVSARIHIHDDGIHSLVKFAVSDSKKEVLIF